MMNRISQIYSHPILRVLLLVVLLVAGWGQMVTPASADCSLTTTGKIPLMDLGTGSYQGFMGGLYPNGSNARPAAHEAAGVQIAQQIRPLNGAGQPDPANGRIVMISVGMSNTSKEFGGNNGFVDQAYADPNINPQLEIVNGAQGGRVASHWADPNSDTWANVNADLASRGLTKAQVQVAWIKQAEGGPGKNGASFTEAATELQGYLEDIARALKVHYPNLRIAYYSSRTRAYEDNPMKLNPEPYAYESGFSVKWMIEKQINGDPSLNYDPAKGQVVAPFLSWAAYLWADGINPRSDGFVWLCSDTTADFTHPSESGIIKVGGLLMDFFSSDSTTRLWFYKDDAPPPTPSPTPSTTPPPTVTPSPTPSATPDPGQTFADVPVTHPYYSEIEALYAAGYTSGCAEAPLRYCPEQQMNRAESGVFVVRGVYGADTEPANPSSSPFADLTGADWALKWANRLYTDGYTSGCGTDPLTYCPWTGHTRAEGAVFYLRMLHGVDYEPPAPSGLFSDVAVGEWYAKWVEAAYQAGILPACGENPLRACPEAALDRGLAAYMLYQAKDLQP
jgi:hypothetical protein